jgi:penicillin-binding protein 1A
MSKKKSNQKPEFSQGVKNKLTLIMWLGLLLPLIIVACLLLFQSEENLPPVAMLDNPPELLASVVLSDDGETELGRYWKINRTSVDYKSISPYVIDALISTEDERFEDHSGVDFRALGRAVVNVGGAGGASTISQQLAKLLFTLQMRERAAIARSKGESNSGHYFGKLNRLNEKARENIIATRLEKRYTKQEIVTMYLNQFDFLYNAVGIENASRVYFNKTPKDLTKDEAAMLVGMCKNPSLINPHTFEIRNYRRSIALSKNIALSDVSDEEVAEKRAADSLRAVSRRNQVLYQWLKNSQEKNPALRTQITKEEYDILKNKPIITDYQVVDHKRGVAPYFREALRNELSNIFSETKPDGGLKYAGPDGAPWDIYRDGLKVYTTIDANMQIYAEESLEKHLRENLQPAFDDNNRNLRNFPFTNSLSDEVAESIMSSARRYSPRYQSLKDAEYSTTEIKEVFNTPTAMRVFSWKGEKDTIMTPNDSIRYYKSFLHAGLISIEPQTGFIKAWVGGANIDHFAYDHVRLGRRQVGSTIKPFVYGAGIAMGVIKPCTMIPDIRHCVDLQSPDGSITGQWCPKNSGGTMGGMSSVANGLAQSKNNITVAIMGKMGGYAGPKTVAKLMEDMDIKLRPEDVVPAMCLGTMDLSLYEMVAAQATFVNQGIFNRPTSILRIEDRNGNVIYSAKPYTKEVLNQNVAYSVLKMMQGVVLHGTAGSLRGGREWGGVRAPTAGKTGTTQNNSDGWFIGLTPELATGVWVGAEDRSVRFKTMTWGQGARLALPVYGYYMQKVYKDPKIGLSTTDFNAPTGFTDFSCFGDNAPEPKDNSTNFGL